MPSLTMKLTPRLHAAITNEAKAEDMEPPEWLRMMLQCAARADEGIRMKLHLPPLGAEDRSMPLLEQAGVQMPEGE